MFILGLPRPPRIVGERRGGNQAGDLGKMGQNGKLKEETIKDRQAVWEEAVRDKNRDTEKEEEVKKVRNQS